MNYKNVERLCKQKGWKLCFGKYGYWDNQPYVIAHGLKTWLVFNCQNERQNSQSIGNATTSSVFGSKKNIVAAVENGYYNLGYEVVPQFPRFGQQTVFTAEKDVLEPADSIERDEDENRY